MFDRNGVSNSFVIQKDEQKPACTTLLEKVMRIESYVRGFVVFCPKKLIKILSPK